MIVSTIGEWMTFQIKTMFLKEVTMDFFVLKIDNNGSNEYGLTRGKFGQLKE